MSFRYKYFNPRSREGSDIVSLSLSNFSKLFQSTLPRGERHCARCKHIIYSLFQSTLPRGERPEKTAYNVADEFQSTLPRGERQINHKIIASCYTISIHAPARGATLTRSRQYDRKTNFNPRSREGSDCHLSEQRVHMVISIHAPARGATTFKSVRHFPAS